MSHDHVTPRTGESAPFHFDDRWIVEAGIESVWAVLERVDQWPQWWPGLTAAERVGPGHVDDDAADISVAAGSRARLVVRAPIGWSLRFSIEVDEVDAPHLIRFRSNGDLRGEGRWSLTASEAGTTIDALWCVTTSRAVVRVMRPLSGLMHGAVMAAGERGLRSRLAELSGS
ncbi:Polyketide cyclase / dehydrase and lipid transport [Brevibacterium siliguriense]|uniref:Polyketide cyclase / dehydrase and lipid transport n=1 Tax=Brevibacterium siliguriense TaxID=1136497 RepID=A0A1H1VJP0_9MICO|nr:SRPBCC family protein [Brevibacterium siliguriense]SDS85174.1 Polyketide cyclase / dehydrase and lipid transport [Brevibacterium siliguriense]